ncbi:hypothetical protein QF035_010730 [Streptomyces umbrinus]|uniref:Uncharacterized protein n=1 Tax=Streptomyces umbrinus TaxID=67370 RepID=A0ABU0TBF5_9ACTN|nr:hypothetical protein [Streptomyces umbrinus]
MTAPRLTDALSSLTAGGLTAIGDGCGSPVGKP